ncbi:glycosyltransferase family 39 protein [Sandaracinomonas limnophila]|uniref:Glycosyltransferase family 39 protein n=1 Tax=Sandaracinomonas limnophila TaxID=1862386 RepID=A0A437PRP4_9BACT|nr:glycosyltransferase family 39 protein [Sandaracinomonas limnophila]RVU24911.1 glycosyltransferase family 39 protein [Sandaracinomonas limnophila]
MLKIVQKFPFIGWFFIGMCIFSPFLGASHLFDWDEVNFAESAREMIVSGDFLGVQINFKPFWEKPPLFIWLQALSFDFFGIFTQNAWVSMEFAARFPNALIGAISLVVFYYIGKKEKNARLGHWWAFSYLAAFTPHLYASTGIIDPLFNLLIFLGVYQFWKVVRSGQLIVESGKWKVENWASVVLSGIFIGLGMLTKGPVALLMWGLVWTVYVLWHKFSIPNFGKIFLAGIVSVLISCLIFTSWYALIAQKYGIQIIKDFFDYQVRLMTTGDAGHGQPFYYHFVVLLIGCFPISIWAGARLFNFKNVLKKGTGEIDFSFIMKILFWVTLILFSIVKTKIVHYSSLCWIPLTYVSAEILADWESGNWVWKKSYTFGLLLVGTIFGLVLTLVPIIGQFASVFSPYIKDAFVQGNLQAPVYWSGFEKYLGILFLVGLWYLMLNKKQPKIQNVFRLMNLGIGVLVAYMAIVVPKIEGYTQAAPIDFYESKLGQKVYIETLGFKSYAHLLYFQKQGPSPTAEALLNAKSLDRPCYFIMKVTEEDRLKYHPNLELLKEENGWLFYKKLGQRPSF